MQPFWTNACIIVPNSKRASTKERRLANQRAEVGNLIDSHDVWGTAPKVLLDRNRVMHRRNTTYVSHSMAVHAPRAQQGGNWPSKESIHVNANMDGFNFQGRCAGTRRRLEGATKRAD